MFIVCDIVAIDARKIYSFPRKGQFNKLGNFSIHMKDRENLTLSKKSDGGDIYIYISAYSQKLNMFHCQNIVSRNETTSR